MASRRPNPSSDLLIMGAAFIGSFFVARTVAARPGSGAGSMSPLLSAAAPVNNNPPRPPSPLPPPVEPIAPVEPVAPVTPAYIKQQSLPPPTKGPGSSQRLIPHAPINMNGQRVLLVGDSLGVGVGPILEKELRALGISAFKNISVGGKNIAQFSDNIKAEGRSLEKALAEYKPTIVFVSLGTNDESIRRIKGGDPRYFTAANLAKNLVGPNFSVAKQRRKAIARLAGKLSVAQTIWLGPPASDPSLWPMDREFRDLLESTARGNYFSTEAVAPQKSGDKIHLTGAGNKTWASAIAKWIRGG